MSKYFILKVANFLALFWQIIPEFIRVLKVSDNEASSDFKIKSPKSGTFKAKLSKNIRPELVE